MADNLSNSVENTGMKKWIGGIYSYADAINQKLRRICPVCQSIRMGLELQNVRSDALFLSFLNAGKAMDKCRYSSQTKHCTMEELLDFIHLVSEDGKEIHSGSSHKSLQLHKLDFLKDFISSAAKRGVGRDKLQDLLAHTRVMVIAAASCSYMLWKPQVMDRTTRSLIYSQYSEMVEVLPVIILKTLRSSDFFVDGDDLLEAFINSLLENHWELLLASNSSFTVSVVKILIKELRFLRNFLKDQRHEGADLDEGIANLICDVVCEAGMLFYSLSLADVKEDAELGLTNWMEKVQFLKQDVTNKYPETSTYKFLRTDELGPTLMAPKMPDSTGELPDSTQKLSGLIDTLRSYLAYLEYFLPSTNEWDEFRPIKIELRLVQTIYSCLDVLFLQDLTSESDDQSLESFLNSLVDAINKKAWEVYFAIQEIREGSKLRKVNGICSSFCHVLEILKLFLFEKVLDKCMCMLSAQSRHCTMEEFLDFIHLVLEDGKEIHSGSSLKSLQLHKLEFLKDFIIFAASRGVGQDKWQDLLVHAKVAVTFAAYYSYILWEPDVADSITRSLIYSQYFSMLNGGSYIRVLKASGFSCFSIYTKMEDNILRAFINSLLENHWELLVSNSSFIVSSMKILIEELRFLKNFIIYKSQEDGDPDEVMANLISDVVREAGIVSYSLSWDDMKNISTRDTKLGLSNWMEKVQLLKNDIVKKYPETSRYKFPRTDELGFMDGLVEGLKELISYNPDSIAFAQGQFDVVLEDLVFLRDFLQGIRKQRTEHEELKALWFRVIDIAYRSEFVIDSLVVGDPSLDCSPTAFNTIKEEIKKMRNEVKDIHMGKRFQIEDFNAPKISNHLPLRSSNPMMNEVIVGFEDQTEMIIDRLEANSAELDIVSIVGMPGGGKTTLAKKVFNDIRSYFHVCAWCCVSQGYQKRKLLLDMLSHSFDELPTGVDEMIDEDLEEAPTGVDEMIDEDLEQASTGVDEMIDEDLEQAPTGLDEMIDEDLEQVLYQSLMGRRYLIVLDDIWDIEAWCDLQLSFPREDNRSRILITSRIHLQVKPESVPHFLRPLDIDESMQLLQMRLLHNKSCPEKIQNLVAKNCKGLPLAVVTVAGILDTLEQDCWEEFAKSLSTALVSGTKECKELLELSYIHLPDYLKPCLLYFGSFLQDEEIPISRLIWLWMAEGFVQKTTMAEDFLKELIDRSLVMVVKNTSRGGIKSCSVHDLVHEFCVTRDKEENFLQLLKVQGKIISPLSEPHRLCAYSLESVPCFRHVNSLKLFLNGYCPRVSSILCGFRILKVLDLRGIHCSIFPAEVEMLVHLRFLALVGNMTSIPSTIVKLWNLETFLLMGLSEEISLPYTLFKMTKLRHLCVNKSVYFSLPEQNFETCCESSNLETFSTLLLSYGQDTVKVIRKMPYLQKLKFNIISWDENYQVLALDFLSHLESLNVHSTSSRRYPSCQLEFSLPLNLKKLTLSKVGLPWASISRFAQLHNLEVLKLLNNACEGETWDMEAGAVFTKLQYLKFDDLEIVHWIACSDNFPRLEQLVLHRCRILQEIPSDMEELECLKIVDVKYCSSSVSTWARNLEQIEGLKVFIH